METEMSLADLTTKERSAVFQAAIRTSKGKLDGVNWDFVWKKAPAGDAQGRQDNYLNGKN
jgi:hypothetical protein